MGKRKLEAHADFERALRNGFGVGRGESYAPWLRVQDVSSMGRSHKIPGIRTNRTHHLLSDLEKRFFLIAEYLPSTIDIREQFPLFPLCLVQNVAEQVGITYPKHPKSKKPIVMTTDFLITKSDGNETKFVAVTVKPSSELTLTRVREKLEIERLWWGMLEVEWKIVTELQLNRVVCDNLDWMSDPLRGGKKLEFEEITSDLKEKVASNISIGVHAWESLVETVGDVIKREKGFCAKLLRSMMWERIFIVDLAAASIQEEGVVRIEQIDFGLTGKIFYEAAV